ncbi:MAG: hypothetical protein ABII90_10690 [Bacteroidota bacterium]
MRNGSRSSGSCFEKSVSKPYNNEFFGIGVREGNSLSLLTKKQSLSFRSASWRRSEESPGNEQQFLY